MKTSPQNSIDYMMATAFFAIVKEMRVFDTVITHLYELFLSLLSEQEKDIDMLKRIVTSLASEKTELSKKIEAMEKWRKRREPILKHLGNYIKERREFLESNK